MNRTVNEEVNKLLKETINKRLVDLPPEISNDTKNENIYILSGPNIALIISISSIVAIILICFTFICFFYKVKNQRLISYIFCSQCCPVNLLDRFRSIKPTNPNETKIVTKNETSNEAITNKILDKKKIVEMEQDIRKILEKRKDSKKTKIESSNSDAKIDKKELIKNLVRNRSFVKKQNIDRNQLLDDVKVRMALKKIQLFVESEKSKSRKKKPQTKVRRLPTSTKSDSKTVSRTNLSEFDRLEKSKKAIPLTRERSSRVYKIESGPRASKTILMAQAKYNQVKLELKRKLGVKTKNTEQSEEEDII